MGTRLDRSGYRLEFEERFDGRTLSRERWVDHYLPQWTTPDRSRARYDLAGEGLSLRIDADQPPWRVEDGGLRVSNLQTGSFSGPAGSELGQHRHRTGLTVTTPQPARRLYTPTGGLVEAEMRATNDPTCMLAFWLIGFEEQPEDSGELCVAELFGEAVGAPARVNVGVKAHHDPRLADDMATVELDLDATAWHRYAVGWGTAAAEFYVDDVLVHRSAQGIDYPMQLMVDLFEFPESPGRDPAAYPKRGWVRSVRGWSRASG
jgi:beta-glucanase (GH16 family)